MNSFKNLRDTINKKYRALEELELIGDFISQKHSLDNIKVNTEPFEYVVLDDFLSPRAYEEVCNFFDKVKDRGVVETRDDDRLHPFLDVEYPYDGYVKSVFPFESFVADTFYTNSWNLYFSELFNRPTNMATSVAFHFHPPHDKTGWVHSDYSNKKFSSKNVIWNGTIPHKRYKDVSQVDTISKRAIALIYYFSNDLDTKDGGGTGLYAGLKDTSPTIVVEPKNNRLLAFSVSPRSYHAFQKNLKDRRSMVQWFHIDEQWCKDNLENKNAK